ncbi:serine/threonine protein kinase [Longilinea arvoryzae]|uniref:non-specific serine/threonine protein kinase n=1 Tax=Longilinea arvoryzae TaxID=360412 RepID=A0A0S7BAE8_9CHLR|nr:serine/threonine-protein kinase [Longilinea arvoryzae]GAP14607.1 serine/threonine protein kinase [Longilinea arvoryzae]
MNSEQEPVRQLPQGFTLVNRYLVQEVIGVGGMGSVYRARDLHFPNVVKLVAVKEMINSAPDPIVRQTITQNFEREANILVTLNHPSIPKIFDYFTFNERSYLVEEFVHGKDLDQILAESEGFLTEDQVIVWAIELCDVLQYLHTHRPEPIIFRDMKPSNVMVNQQGHIVLVDFGIAKIFKTGQKGTMIGTEGYSPPEQYRGEATPMADIYALGATLHHLITRKDPRLEPPFSFAERPVRQINPAISAEFDAIIQMALKYNPQERFPSAVAMKDALMLTAKKTGALTRLSIHPTTAPEQTIKPLWTFECEDEIRSSPLYDNGSIYIGSYDNNLYSLNATNGEFQWKFPTEGGIVGRPASQDGAIYIGSEDNNVYAISVHTGKLAWSYATEGPIRSSPRIAEGHIFVGSDDGFLYAINLISQRRTWRFDAGAPIRSSPFIAQDYIYAGSEGGELVCLDFRGQSKWQFRAKRAITSSPLVAQGIVFVGSLDSTFYAVDAKSGWAMWRFRMGKGTVSSPCRAENFVFIGSADGNIYCIDATTSKEIWTFKTDHQVSGSPVVYKENLYCGSADGNLYCLDIKNGRLKWKFPTGGPITGTPIVYNGVLYIGSADRIVYALLI